MPRYIILLLAALLGATAINALVIPGVEVCAEELRAMIAPAPADGIGLTAKATR